MKNIKVFNFEPKKGKFLDRVDSYLQRVKILEVDILYDPEGNIHQVKVHTEKE